MSTWRGRGPAMILMMVIEVMMKVMMHADLDITTFILAAIKDNISLGTIKKLRNPFLDPLDLPPPPCNPM